MLYRKKTEYDNECAICLEKLNHRSCIYMTNVNIFITMIVLKII